MSKKPTWEYLVLRMKGDSVDGNEKSLTALGSDGWELVAVASWNFEHYVYLKRATR